MNYTTIEKHTDFQELFDIDILITGNPKKQRDELEHNTWCISFEQTFVKELALSDLQWFISTLVETRVQQLKKQHNHTPVTFYVWFEEVSLQLCFDFLSGKNIQLPFGRKLNLLSSVDPVLNQFLTEAQSEKNALSWENFTILEPGDPGFGEDEDDAPDWIQDVYVTTLP